MLGEDCCQKYFRIQVMFEFEMRNVVQEILSKLKAVVHISTNEKPFPHSEVPSFQAGLLGFPKLFSAICCNFR